MDIAFLYDILKEVLKFPSEFYMIVIKIQEVFYVEKIPDNEKSNQDGDQGA